MSTHQVDRLKCGTVLSDTFCVALIHRRRRCAWELCSLGRSLREEREGTGLSCIPGSKTVCQTVHTCVSGGERSREELAGWIDCEAAVHRSCADCPLARANCRRAKPAAQPPGFSAPPAGKTAPPHPPAGSIYSEECNERPL